MRWILGAILLLSVGYALQLGLLVYAMYVLLGVMLISRFLTRSWIENIEVDRTCDRITAQIDEQATVTITVRNTGRVPVVWLLLEDAVPRQALQQRPPRIAIDAKRIAIMQLAGMSQRKLTYNVRFLMRGYYQLGPVLAESGDLFGLHRRFQIKAKAHFVLVFPKVVPLTGYDLASRRPIGEVRLTHRLFEDPTRIAGVRPYQPGDALGRIHWRATARTGELHCKMYEPSCIAGVTMLLDLHQASYLARGEPHRSELAITCAASLANAMYQMGQQFGLITNGRDAADRIREEDQHREYQSRSVARGMAEMVGESNRLSPLVVTTQRGPEQLMRILETLGRVELSDGLNFSELVIETTGRLPTDATVVAILGQVTAEMAISLGQLRRRGYAVSAFVILPDEDAQQPGMGALIAAGIDVRQIDSDDAVGRMCSAQLVR